MHMCKTICTNSILLKTDLQHVFVQSTVRLRFKKSISGHCFLNTRKFDNNDYQHHRYVIVSV